ncbi:hypothetical protein [uncultured Bacteroides sp.]|uniref:hypothetical protein n=1 Tax=uncultured Bacteroides sp. TaxID=162156 RepID=UPI002AABEB7D|nr:hypothetical protein [uncultured Bacteroides sp.]
MDDILQYIVITIVIIAAIISKIRNQEKVNGNKENKRPDLAQKEDEKTNHLPNNWEKWLNGNEEKAEPLIQNPVNTVLHPQSSQADLTKKNKIGAEKDSTGKGKLQSNNTTSEDRPDIQLSSLEDVRRAIIYSEIINRKY